MANVPMIENGSARLGITVAETLRRNRKMTLIDQAQRHQHGELDVVVGFADGVGPVVQDVHVDRRRELRLERSAAGASRCR